MILFKSLLTSGRILIILYNKVFPYFTPSRRKSHIKPYFCQKIRAVLSLNWCHYEIFDIRITNFNVSNYSIGHKKSIISPLTPRKRPSLLSACMWYTRDRGERGKCILSIPGESCDSKVKLLKQFGRYFLIWFSKSFLLIINSLINTSKFLWASLLGKILIHESPSQTHAQFSRWDSRTQEENICKRLHMERQFPFFFFLFLLQMHCLHAWHTTSIVQCDSGTKHRLSNLRNGGGGRGKHWNRTLISLSLFIPSLFKATAIVSVDYMLGIVISTFQHIYLIDLHNDSIPIYQWRNAQWLCCGYGTTNGWHLHASLFKYRIHPFNYHTNCNTTLYFDREK